MANKSCAACDDLRTNSPNFIVNGLGNTECTSLKNDTGLNPSSGHNDCTDLDNLNDCLVGNMEYEVDAYGVCNWKDFMKNFIPNLWTTFKAIICAICGIWSNIHSLWSDIKKIWTELDKHECEIKYLYNGASFSFGEHTTGKESRLVPGKGVDFSLRQGSESHSSDITITYIAGGLASLAGSLRTFISSFVDADGNTKSGNSLWDFRQNPDMPKGGELLYEVRIKKSEYPQIKQIFYGHAFQTGGDNQNFICRILTFDGDRPPSGHSTTFAYGQHGWCDYDGSPSETGYSSGRAVHKGWFYVQMRMYGVFDLGVGTHTDGSGASKRASDFSPAGYIGIRMDRDDIDC